MPRGQLKTSFQPVVRKPRPRGRRKAQEATIYEIRPRSPLARYLHENADSGLPIHELVEQFQEYDCEHEWPVEPIGVTEQEQLFQCSECGLIKHRLRPGRTR